MTLRTLVNEAEKLSASERWELVDELLRMSKDEQADTTLTPAQATDLQRRLKEAESGQVRMIPGDEAVAMLKKRP